MIFITFPEVSLLIFQPSLQHYVVNIKIKATML